MEIYECAKKGSQFIIITHFPILLGLPGADFGPIAAIMNGYLTERKQNSEVKSLFQKNVENKLKNLISTVLSVAFVLTIMICFICDLCISGRVSWSLIVAVSLIFSWIVLLPLLKMQTKYIRNTLYVISIAVIPYLRIMGGILNESLIYTLGAVIALISMIGLWCTYIVFCKLPHRRLCALGIVLLLAIPVSLGINHAVSYFLRGIMTGSVSDIVNCIVLSALAIVCFGIDYVLVHKM